jgi:hypothetical protein
MPLLNFRFGLWEGRQSATFLPLATLAQQLNALKTL